jgi:hypothetical protein
MLILNAYLSEAGDEGVPSAAQLQLSCSRKSRCSSLVLGQYYWGLWEVNMQAPAVHPPIPYLTYCKIRLAQAQKIS